MNAFVFPPAPVAAIPVQDSEQIYAVSRIFCVGRNYAAHAREMGMDARETPFYFCKNPQHLMLSGQAMSYPPGTADLHHEIELVIALGREAHQIETGQAWDCIWAYACGLDMTRRDLQAEAKSKGRPWSFAKDFEQAAVIGPLVPASKVGRLKEGRVQLCVNGQLRQDGNLNELIWSLPEIVANLSCFYHLKPGDLIYTGTPAGVGAVAAGDRLQGEIEGVGGISLEIV